MYHQTFTDGKGLSQKHGTEKTMESHTSLDIHRWQGPVTETWYRENNGVTYITRQADGNGPSQKHGTEKTMESQILLDRQMAAAHLRNMAQRKQWSHIYYQTGRWQGPILETWYRENNGVTDITRQTDGKGPSQKHGTEKTMESQILLDRQMARAHHRNMVQRKQWSHRYHQTDRWQGPIIETWHRENNGVTDITRQADGKGPSQKHGTEKTMESQISLDRQMARAHHRNMVQRKQWSHRYHQTGRWQGPITETWYRENNGVTDITRQTDGNGPSQKYGTEKTMESQISLDRQMVRAHLRNMAQRKQWSHRYHQTGRWQGPILEIWHRENNGVTDITRQTDGKGPSQKYGTAIERTTQIFAKMQYSYTAQDPHPPNIGQWMIRKCHILSTYSHV